MALPEWAKPLNGQNQVQQIPEWAKPIQVQPSEDYSQQMMVSHKQLALLETPGLAATPESNQEGLYEQIQGRIEKTREMVGRRSPDVSTGIMQAPGTLALAGGQLAGAGVDIIGAGISEGVKKITPEPVKEFAKEKLVDFLQTDIGKAGLSAIQGGKETWDSFEKSNPDAAMALGGIFNLSALGIVKKTAATAEKEAFDIASDVASMATNPRVIDRKIHQAARAGITKGIRPGVEGKRTFEQGQAYFKKAGDAVKAIVENKQNLKLFDESGEIVTGVLPKNLTQFSQAVSETKKAIFKQYDDLAKTASDKVVIDLNDIAKKLTMTASRKDIGVASPHVARYTNQLADRLREAGTLTTTEAQELIKSFNAKLSAYYKNPTYGAALRQSVDAMVVNRLRIKLDNAIKSATGSEYQALKKQYGSLLSIERDLNRRLIVDLRKNEKGLVDFSDILTVNQLTEALITHSPASFSKAIATKGVASYIKRMNDPNKAIEKMFNNVDLLMQRGSGHKSVLFRKAVETKKGIEKLDKMREFDHRNPTGGTRINPNTGLE